MWKGECGEAREAKCTYQVSMKWKIVLNKFISFTCKLVSEDEIFKIFKITLYSEQSLYSSV